MASSLEPRDRLTARSAAGSGVAGMGTPQASLAAASHGHPGLCDLASVVHTLRLPWMTSQQQAAALGYGAAAYGPPSRQPLAEWLDGFMAELASGRRILWFDELARPAGFTAGRRIPAADASILTHKKDVLDHCGTRLQELLAVGEALMALRAAPPYAALPTGTAISLVDTLTRTDQYKVFRDSAGQPLGLLSWAWISAWTVARLQGAVRTPLHPCEWNEGDQLYFRDIAVSRACADAMCADLSGGLFGTAAFCWVALTGGSDEGGTLVRLAPAQRRDFSNWLYARVLGRAA